MAVTKKKTAAKKKPVAKKKGWKPSANVAGGKSYSQVAREVLTRTNGNRAKATAKLKELGCTCASQIAWKMAKGLGFVDGGGQKKSTAKKPAAKKKSVAKKSTVKKKLKSKQKPVEDEYDEVDEDELDGIVDEEEDF